MSPEPHALSGGLARSRLSTLLAEHKTLIAHWVANSLEAEAGLEAARKQMRESQERFDSCHRVLRDLRAEQALLEAELREMTVAGARDAAAPAP